MESRQIEKLFPQTRAEAIGKWGCLAMCYLFSLGIEGTAGEYMKLVSDAMDTGALDRECTVLDGTRFVNRFAGDALFRVTKKDISDISEIGERAPVRYDYNGRSHWVVVERGRIVFNSLESSVCVSKGRPVTARIIERVR